MLTGMLHGEGDFLGSMLDLAQIVAPPGSAANPSSPATEPPRLRTKTHNWAFREDFPDYDLRSRLGDIRCPTFVAVGALDPVMPVACGEELAAKIPNAELVMFSRSGHNPAMEESALFRAAVLRFLTENSPA